MINDPSFIRFQNLVLVLSNGFLRLLDRETSPFPDTIEGNDYKMLLFSSTLATLYSNYLSVFPQNVQKEILYAFTNTLIQEHELED